MAQDRIGLEGMVFYGYHGVKEEERRMGQRFVVDVEMVADLSRAASSDRLEDTLDYGVAYRTVREVMEGPSVQLLEALAEEIAQRLLAALPAEEVRVRVSKPGVAIKGSVLDRSWVEIVRRRSTSEGR
ncbi:MAG: dihydroneopterin aldolase [Chloroflexi bacterium]|nr:dihydroneopterin aldolase [Chloroflexota bacterium]